MDASRDSGSDLPRDEAPPRQPGDAEDDRASAGKDSIVVRMFGLLHGFRRERGLPSTVTIPAPPEGMPAREVAVSLDLPLELIEGVFVNHTVYDLDHLLHPGDRTAFVPVGTPGPHRFFLGLYHAGRSSQSDA